MPALLLILIKINLVLLLFAAAYYLVLRRLTFYTLNRLFLIVGIVFSSIYPFINLTGFFEQQTLHNPQIATYIAKLPAAPTVKNTAAILNYGDLLLFLFFAGAIILVTRLFVQLLSLYRIHRSSEPGYIGRVPVRILRDELSPFSFWQTVYVNPAIHQRDELNTILEHEHIHVKEWHTLDILLAELSVIIYWFNPGIWLMKKAIKENIEFITDARIVNNGINKKKYQYSLLAVGNMRSGVALVNHFNLSDLKKRIKMMNAKRSSPFKMGVYAFLLPLILLVTLAFTVRREEIKAPVRYIQAVFKQEIITPDKAAEPEKLPAVAAKKQYMPVKRNSAPSVDSSLLQPVSVIGHPLTGDESALKSTYIMTLTKELLDSLGLTAGVNAEKIGIAVKRVRGVEIREGKPKGKLSVAFGYTNTPIPADSISFNPEDIEHIRVTDKNIIIQTVNNPNLPIKGYIKGLKYTINGKESSKAQQ